MRNEIKSKEVWGFSVYLAEQTFCQVEDIITTKSHKKSCEVKHLTILTDMGLGADSFLKTFETSPENNERILRLENFALQSGGQEKM